MNDKQLQFIIYDTYIVQKESVKDLFLFLKIKLLAILLTLSENSPQTHGRNYRSSVYR